jgi:hypothetical protein
MASEEALSAVSVTLRDLLGDRMVRAAEGTVSFSFGSPAPAADGGSAVVNLYLFRVHENPAFRNQGDPRRPEGARDDAPLALTLSYLVTTYGSPAVIKGPDDPSDTTLLGASLADLDSQVLLGDVMRVLHDFPTVTRTMPVLGTFDPHGDGLLMHPDLRDDYEPVRVTPVELSLDDLSKLWTAFGGDFQRSAGYEVSVVRIEGPPRPAVTPQPVLTRGITVNPSLLAPPAVTGIAPAAVASGETVTIAGVGLGSQVDLRFSDPYLTDAPRDLTVPAVPTTGGGSSVTFTPNAAAAPWNAFGPGPKAVRVVVTGTGPNPRRVTTGALPFSILPRVVSLSAPSVAFDGVSTLTIAGTYLGMTGPGVSPLLAPAVAIGGYTLPPASLSFTTALTRITAITVTLPARAADAGQPAVGATVAVRVRTNNVESRSWTAQPDGTLAVDPATAVTVTA